MNIPTKYAHSSIERTPNKQAALDNSSEDLGCRCTLLKGTSAQVLPAELPTTGVKTVLLWKHALNLLTLIDFYPKVAKINSKYQIEEVKNVFLLLLVEYKMDSDSQHTALNSPFNTVITNNSPLSLLKRPHALPFLHAPMIQLEKDSTHNGLICSVTSSRSWITV